MNKNPVVESEKTIHSLRKEIKELKNISDNEEKQSAFIDMLIEELPQYGIDTSKWEYDYGDCCEGGVVEFISRCIRGYADATRPSAEEYEYALNESGELKKEIERQQNLSIEFCNEIKETRKLLKGLLFQYNASGGSEWDEVREAREYLRTFDKINSQSDSNNK